LKKFANILLFLMLFTLILAGCSSGTPVGTSSEEPATNDGTSSEEAGEEVSEDGGGLVYDSSTAGEVTFWTFTADVYEDIVVNFNKEYPNINIGFISKIQ